MLRISLFLVVFLVAGCGSSPHPAATSSTASIDGVHTSQVPHTAINRFAGHNAALSIECRNGTVSATWPGLGFSAVRVTAGDWNFGDTGEWRGEFVADDATWFVHVMTNVDDSMSVALTSGGSEGRSDTIVWKFLPVGRG